MNDNEIIEVYRIVEHYHQKYLSAHGVKLPKLHNKDGSYVKDALVLIYLARFYPNTNDVQQARHLGVQKGWFIPELSLENSTNCFVKDISNDRQ